MRIDSDFNMVISEAATSAAVLDSPALFSCPPTGAYQGGPPFMNSICVCPSTRGRQVFTTVTKNKIIVWEFYIVNLIWCDI